MFNLNLLLKISFLISGNYDGFKIRKTKFLHFSHFFFILLFFFEFTTTLIVALYPELKYNLSVFYLTDGLTQRLWDFCISLVHLSFALNHIYYYQFNSKPKHLKFLNYLLCRSEKELRIKYKIDKIASKKIFNMISIKDFGFISILYNILPFIYFFIVELQTIRSIFSAFNHTSQFNFFVFSIPTALLLNLAYFSESNSVATLYLIFYTNCKFIGFRIDDLNRKLKRQIIYEIDSNKYYPRLLNVKRETFDTMKQLDSILRFHKSNQYFVDRSITGFYLCVLLIALFFPYIMLFEKNSALYQAILVITYSITIGFTSYSIVWSSELVYSKFNELRNLKFTYLMYSYNSRTKFKFLTSIEDSDDQMYFNCIKIFKYKDSFLLFWIIESISMVLLIYGAQNL